MSDGTVLVTGAAGLVGAEVCARMARQGRRVLAMVHSKPEIRTVDGPLHATRVRVVNGDVTAPGLGLDPTDPLVRRIDTVVHCAATTNFSEPDDVYRRLNIGGTENAVAFAQRASARLVHVSTAYVCGKLDELAGPGATFLESELDRGQRFNNGYEASKLQAERIVRDAERGGLPVAIVRPGIVCGHSEDGRITDRRNLYLVLKLITEGKLRTLPGRYGATLALAPVDMVADVIAHVVADGISGRTFHAVGRDALSLRDVSDVISEYPCFDINRFVPPAGFDPDELDRRERAYFDRVARDYTDYFVRTVRFDTTATRELLAAHDAALPASGRELLRAIFDDCLRVGFLADGLRSVDEAVASVAAGASGGHR